MASGFGATAEVDFRLIFAPLVNHETEFHAIADAAAELVGDDNVNRAAGAGDRRRRISRSCWRQVPGAYINLGNGEARRCTIITTTSTTRRFRSGRRCMRGWSNGSCLAALE